MYYMGVVYFEIFLFEIVQNKIVAAHLRSDGCPGVYVETRSLSHPWAWKCGWQHSCMRVSIYYDEIQCVVMQRVVMQCISHSLPLRKKYGKGN